MKPKIIIALIITTVVPGFSHAALEFSGYMTTSRDFPMFVVTDTEKKESSDWITIGQTFSGYTLLAFDSKTEVLSVKKGASTLNLQLKGAQIKKATVEEAMPRGALIYSMARVVVLADVHCDKDFIYVDVREVWKNLGPTLPDTIKFPRKKGDSFNSALPPCVAIVAMEIDGRADSRIISFSDGFLVSGQQGFTIDSVRQYFRKQSNQVTTTKAKK